MEIREIAARETWQLRQEVLRPGRPLEDCHMPEDQLPATFHLGAFSDGALVGVASYYQQAGDAVLEAIRARELPEIAASKHWRLRQMASSPAHRGEGIGSALLKEGIRRVKEQGGRLLWFNARTGSMEFYEKNGFHVLGEEFDIPGVGPHYVMWAKL